MRCLSRWFSAWLILLAVSAQAQDGWFDPGFGSGGRNVVPLTGIYDNLRQVRVQPDGKFVLAGNCIRELPSGVRLTYFCLARLHPNGDFDRSFGPAGLGYLLSDQLALAGISFELSSLALLPDGRILVGGNSMNSAPVLVRIKADGSVAEDVAYVDFNPAQPGSSLLARLETQRDGRVLAVGSALSPAGGYDFAVKRVHADFSVDAGFGSAGVAFAGFPGDPLIAGASAGAVTLQADGRIVLAGMVSDNSNKDDFAVARLLANGQPDPSFNGTGRTWFSKADDDDLEAVAIDHRGRIVVAGSAQPYGDAWGYDFIVNRLLPNGMQDPLFGNGGPVDLLLDFGGDRWDVLRTLVVQGDDKIIAAGRSSTSQTQWVFSLARLNENGIQDGSFGTNGASRGVFEGGDDTNLLAEAVGLALGPSGLYVFGNARHRYPGQILQSFGIARVTLDCIFKDDFDP